MAAGQQRWSAQIVAGNDPASSGVLLLRYRRHSGGEGERQRQGEEQVASTVGATKATVAGATSAAVKRRRRLERGQMTRPQSTAFEMSNVIGILCSENNLNTKATLLMDIYAFHCRKTRS